MDFSIIDLMAKSDAMSRKDSEKHEHKIHPLAQSMELFIRWNRAQIKADLKPGDLCREKEGISSFRATGTIAILWRWLDETNQQDATIINNYIRKTGAVIDVDCFVGVLDEDDGNLVILPHESWRLEPYKPEGRLPLVKVKAKQNAT